jgi:hypothetical protein
VIAVWLGRYRRSDATLSHMSCSRKNLQQRFGTLRAADRHVSATRLVSTSQAWLCLGAVGIQLGRFWTAKLWPVRLDQETNYFFSPSSLIEAVSFSVYNVQIVFCSLTSFCTYTG